MTQSEQISFLESKVLSLEGKIVLLLEQNALLRVQVADLESKLNKNSRNSSKPPSSDRFVKHTKSLRKATGRKAGGQLGHIGSTLEMSAVPDIVVSHDVQCCDHCGKNIAYLPAQDYEQRQVLDIPPIHLQVTEHRCAIKRCPHCEQTSKAKFPATISQPVQYGANIGKWAMYLMHYQLLPVQRTAELFKELLNHSINASTLMKMSTQCNNQLAGFETEIVEQLSKEPVVHFDETGYYINNKRQWLHSASTAGLTFYFPHEKRGKQAMEAMNILPQFTGTAIHDFWSSYMDYPCNHGLCNVHHLRDLIFCEEQEKSSWAKEMKALLLNMKQQVDDAKAEQKTHLTLSQITDFENQFEQLIMEGKKAHPPPEKMAGKRGRVKRSKTQNLLQRFDEQRKYIFGFVYSFQIPFDNNQAERDIRMMKVKQKISGCFRTMNGAKIFARIRSYLATCKKQGINLIQALYQAIIGMPFTTQNFSY